MKTLFNSQPSAQSTSHHKTSLELIALAAIWGASFMFMRVGTPEFGPILFTTLRTGIAAIFLFICLSFYRQTAALKGHWREICVVGALNTAIPFALFGFATLTLTAGTTSVLNATAPMFGAIVGYVWLKDKLSVSATFGLLIGFVGVYLLVSENLHLNASAENNALLPTLAAMLAALCYGVSANYTKKHLTGVKPLVLAAGSQISATAMLLPVTLFFIPERLPSENAIWSALLIGVICTGFAYILFFRLIAALGPAKAISVTYLIPAFGILWGALFLGESISVIMLVGSAVILLGVALATGVIKFRK